MKTRGTAAAAPTGPPMSRTGALAFALDVRLCHVAVRAPPEVSPPPAVLVACCRDS